MGVSGYDYDARLLTLDEWNLGNGRRFGATLGTFGSITPTYRKNWASIACGAGGIGLGCIYNRSSTGLQQRCILEGTLGAHRNLIIRIMNKQY